MKRFLSILLSIVILFSMSVPVSALSAGNSNPVIKGSFADPDIDYFDCKYWIFPTTDGNPGWSGTQFHAFSSEDMINWVDEGVILDVADKSPSKNSKGIQIASSKWSEGNAWAPSIEKVNGKYYFYYCGRIRSDLLDKYAVKNPDNEYYNDKAIGVAVADNPAGPYVALDEPILYPAMIRDLGMNVGQVIDPSVFIDDDGTPYIFFGNGIAYGVQLSSDMMSVKSETMVLYGIWEYRESLVVFKRNGTYYFTWSDFGTDEAKYCVKYATTKTLDGKRDLKPQATILQMDESNAIYGTGHQSILFNPMNEKYYIAYGRHQTKNGVSVNDPGNFREVCINELTFSFTGNINAVKPSSSIAPVSSHRYATVKVVDPTCTSDGYTVKQCELCSKKIKTNYKYATGHDYVEGYISYNRCDKSDYETRKCNKCGLYQEMPTTPVMKHSMASKITKKPTLASTGVKTYYCKNCSYKYKKSVPKLTVAEPKSVSASAKSKAFTLKWKKNSNATGYVIEYSTSKSFKNAKAIKIKKNSTVSKTVKSLKSKKTYYVRIKAYKTYNKKNYYSSWVSKTVKVK